MASGDTKSRNVLFALLGAMVLVVKRHYSGPYSELVNAYAGNISVSFALYFAALCGVQGHQYAWIVAALLTLIAVSAFELTNGFGLMSNTYDRVDLLANTVGIGFGIAVDLLVVRLSKSRRIDLKKTNSRRP